MFDAQGKPTENGMEFQRWGLIEVPTALRTTAAPDLNQRYGGLNCKDRVIDLFGVEAGPLIARLHERRKCASYEKNADLSFADTARARHERREFQRRTWLSFVVFTLAGGAIGFFFSYLLPHLLTR
jgi:hypothetical protein